jgi:radical SAM superfamily enzyme YgiQ (UPF0313 family)
VSAHQPEGLEAEVTGRNGPEPSRRSLNVVLISTYELGRQPFGVASPASWLKRAGCSVTCVDLALDPLPEEAIAACDLVAFYLPMHTAARLATGALAKVQALNPQAHICFYGLYAPVNAPYLRKLGGDTILGGEFEEGLLSLAQRLSMGAPGDGRKEQPEPLVSLGRQRFVVPDRSGLPALHRYARLQLSPDRWRTVGYTEASRGCKYLCRHCPVVPVYRGWFRIVGRDVVMEDIRQQVAAGAGHITFGDPDFFNGPAHGLSIVNDLHREFPGLTYDVTIKVEHLLKHGKHLPILRDTGCLFVTSAVESLDDRVLQYLDKGHTRSGFLEAVRLCREVGLHLDPTFVTFTPWTTLTGYLELLEVLADLDLVDHVAPVQYAIRLLIAGSSRLLELDEVRQISGDFDEERLVHPWVHPDARVDRLYEEVSQAVQQDQRLGKTRRTIFRHVWRLARRAHDGHMAESLKVAALDHAPPQAAVPYLTEPWYC